MHLLSIKNNGYMRANMPYMFVFGCVLLVMAKLL